jgi:hypothetical protein
MAFKCSDFFQTTPSMDWETIELPLLLLLLLLVLVEFTLQDAAKTSFSPSSKP